MSYVIAAPYSRGPGTFPRMRGRTGRFPAIFLVIVAVTELAAFFVVWHVFVHTRTGQMIDTIGLNGNRFGRDQVAGLTDTALDAVSVASLAIATAVIVCIALLRRRILLAFMAALLIGGTNLATQMVKHLTVRPDYGIDPERVFAGNSLPSGHTAVAASVAVALVLVLPPKIRGVAGVLGAAYAGFVGIATLSAGWHRPSDAIASLLLVGVGAAVVGVPLVLAHHRGRVEPGPPHWIAVTVLLIAAIGLLLGAALGLALTQQVVDVPPEALSQRRFFVAYVGGAAGIAGVAAMTMALVLATVHWVVPRRVHDRPPRHVVSSPHHHRRMVSR